MLQGAFFSPIRQAAVAPQQHTPTSPTPPPLFLQFAPDMLKFLTQKLRAQSLNEVQPFEPAETDKVSWSYTFNYTSVVYYIVLPTNLFTINFYSTVLTPALGLPCVH